MLRSGLRPYPSVTEHSVFLATEHSFYDTDCRLNLDKVTSFHDGIASCKVLEAFVNFLSCLSHIAACLLYILEAQPRQVQTCLGCHSCVAKFDK